MFKKIHILATLALLIIIPIQSKSQTILRAAEGKFALKFAFSSVSTSENGEYTFILVSSKSIKSELEETKKNWKIVNTSKKDIVQFEKSLLRDLGKEQTLREQYKKSGLYKTNTKELVFAVDSFPQETDKIFVANDGTYAIGFNPFIFVQNMPETTPQDILENKETALFTLTAKSSGIKDCSYKIIDLNLSSDSLEKTSDGYFWANRNASLNNENQSLEIIKSNGEKIVFDVKSCKVIQGDAQKISEADSSNKNGQSSFCFGIALLIILASWRSS